MTLLCLLIVCALACVRGQVGSTCNNDPGVFLVMEPLPSLGSPLVLLQLIETTCTPLMQTRATPDTAWSSPVPFSVSGEGLLSARGSDSTHANLRVYCATRPNTEVQLALGQPIGEPGDCGLPVVMHSTVDCQRVEVTAALAEGATAGRLMHFDLSETLRPGTRWSGSFDVPLHPDSLCEAFRWEDLTLAWTPLSPACPSALFTVSLSECVDPVLYRLQFEDQGPLWPLALWAISCSAFFASVAAGWAKLHEKTFCLITALMMATQPALVARVGFSSVSTVSIAALAVPYIIWVALHLWPCRKTAYQLPSKECRGAVLRYTAFVVPFAAVMISYIVLQR